MTSPGDWLCGCEYINFKKRDSCQWCGNPKYGGPIDVPSEGYNRTEGKPGDWYCGAMNCGAHNYAGRSSCRLCGATKGGNNGCALPGWKAGDWNCTRPGCSTHNYARRSECYICKTPRE